MTPSVNTTKISIPKDAPLHLSYKGQLTGDVVYCTNPDVYTVTDIVRQSVYDPTPMYYARKFPYPRTYNGYPYDTWIVNAENVEPHL